MWNWIKKGLKLYGILSLIGMAIWGIMSYIGYAVRFWKYLKVGNYAGIYDETMRCTCMDLITGRFDANEEQP